MNNRYLKQENHYGIDIVFVDCGVTDEVTTGVNKCWIKKEYFIKYPNQLNSALTSQVFNYLHNLNGPADLFFTVDGHVWREDFYINGELYNDLERWKEDSSKLKNIDSFKSDISDIINE